MSAEPRSGATDQRPIADYALLSDCQSAALVDGDGCVVWYCPSRFDGPSVFASLLDPSAGEWRLSPSGGEFDCTRRYLDGSLVLETTFSTASGEARLTDALLLGDGERGHGIGLRSPHILVRVFEMRAGTMDVAGAFLPRPEYGLVTPELAAGTTGVLAESAGMRFRLAGPPPDRVVRGEARWDRRLQVGDRLVFALQSAPTDGPEPQPWEQAEVVRRGDDLATRDGRRLQELGLPLRLDQGREHDTARPGHRRLPRRGDGVPRVGRRRGGRSGSGRRGPHAGRLRRSGRARSLRA